MPIVLTVSEVAKLLGLPRMKVYLMIEAKLLEAFKLGADWRITRRSVNKYL